MADGERYLETNPEDAKIQQARRGEVKLNRNKSKFAQQAKNKEEFEEKADAAHDQLAERRTRALEAIQQFWNSLKDKTLIANKGPMQKSLEKEMFSKLIEVATEMNTDENLREGEGSVALIGLLLKAIHYQRDVINELDYKVSQQDLKLAQIHKKLSRPDAESDVK